MFHAPRYQEKQDRVPPCRLFSLINPSLMVSPSLWSCFLWRANDNKHGKLLIEGIDVKDTGPRYVLWVLDSVDTQPDMPSYHIVHPNEPDSGVCLPEMLQSRLRKAAGVHTQYCAGIMQEDVPALVKALGVRHPSSSSSHSSASSLSSSSRGTLLDAAKDAFQECLELTITDDSWMPAHLADPARFVLDSESADAEIRIPLP